MENELIIYEAQAPTIKERGKNYVISLGDCCNLLKRDVDFGVIPKAKKPSLYKAGAEKICMTYGLLQHYSIESKLESLDPALFYYTIRCDLVKVGADGREYVFSSGFGSANTNERRNGMSSAFDAANSTLKMAQKRALVAAAIAISGVSDMFSQDMENEEFMATAAEVINQDSPDSKLTKAQIRRIFALGSQNGLNQEQIKTRLAACGFNSTKEITLKDYNRVCDAMTAEDKKDDNNKT